MPAVVIIVVVVAVVVIVALVALNPMLRRREDEAIATVKRELGGTELIEPRATAMGTDPEEAGGIRGMACLGMSDGELLAVPWTGSASWRIDRSSVVAVESPADDARAVPKATVTITYEHDEGQATAMFRLRDAGDWLTALGGEVPGADAGAVVDSEAVIDDEVGAERDDDGPPAYPDGLDER
jgi:hypothetical protein